MSVFRGDEDFDAMERRPGGGGGGAVAWLLGSIGLAMVCAFIVWVLRLAAAGMR